MTDGLFEQLAKIDSWRLRGCRARASFTAATWTGRRFASMSVRRRRGESIEAMMWRGLAELNRRLLDGMPRPRPEVVARQKLRRAVSPSRFSN
jgi:hypothetical protein